MTTRYRVEYALKTHRRDQLIEWIKGLLAVPFVLNSEPTGTYDIVRLENVQEDTRRRYREIFRDVERLIDSHIAHIAQDSARPSKLKYLVPSIGGFFTQLPLEAAFTFQDNQKFISSRRFVAPSFNDVRSVLNTAQCMALVHNGPLRLITFDGDLTLYEDGRDLGPENPVISRVIGLLQRGIYIGIVTAAGYKTANGYARRLHGLLAAIKDAESAGQIHNPRLVVVGGECNYLCVYDGASAGSDNTLLRMVPRSGWMLSEMKGWSAGHIKDLIDLGAESLATCRDRLGLPADIVRKEYAVGIVPVKEPPNIRFSREQLEETVLVTQQQLENSEPGLVIPFCVFNGGQDVFVDIGDKSWGVKCCQAYLTHCRPSDTLHIGDQFLSVGANDYKARNACTTAWVANPAETVELLDDLLNFLQKTGRKDGVA